jgi:drug/metabolite transporter (DMT)-like permease
VRPSHALAAPAPLPAAPAPVSARVAAPAAALRDPALRAAWAAAATGVLVGLLLAASRAVVPETGPSALAFLRYAVGAAVLVPVALGRSPGRLAGRDAAALALLGVFQFGAVVWLLNVAVQTIPAAHAALVFALATPLTLLLSVAAGRDRMSGRLGTGVALCAAGVGAALAGPALAGGPGTLAGYGCAAAAAAVASLCAVGTGRRVLAAGTLRAGAVSMAGAALALALPVLPEAAAAAPRLSAAAWLAVGGIGLASAAAWLLWLEALRHGTPARAAAFLALGPVAAALPDAVLTGAPPSWTLVPACAALAAGLRLASR